MAIIKGKWSFIKTPNISTTILFEAVSFTIGDASYSQIGVTQEQNTIIYVPSAGGGDVIYDGNGTGWIGRDYRTLDFGEAEQTVSDEFFIWFSSNATQGELGPEISTTPNSLDLMTLNLPAGVYSIVVRAKGTDFKDSADSIEVIYAIASEDPLNPAGIIPEGATYTVASSSASLAAGNPFPAVAESDTYSYGDYTYTYQAEPAGWKVNLNTDVTDKAQTSYGIILESVNSEPITSMSNTFLGCGSLTTSPAIPSSVTDMSHTFQRCTSLTTIPKIPESVTNVNGIFMDCASLNTYEGSTDPDGDFSNYTFPGSVTKVTYAFYGCTSLASAPKIPENVTDITCVFNGCTSLVDVPEIPNGVTNMSSTFAYCANLVNAPVIPNSVTNMYSTFEGCTSLATAPEIPSRVKYMNSTFADCTALTGTITINANPRYEYCFKNVDMTNITLVGESYKLKFIGATGLNWVFDESYANAYELLQTIYDKYNAAQATDDTKLWVCGGNINNLDTCNPEGPAAFVALDNEDYNQNLAIPAAEADKIASAASMFNITNSNTFNCFTVQLNDGVDADAFVSTLKDSVLARQWIMGSPEKLVIAKAPDNCIIAVWGLVQYGGLVDPVAQSFATIEGVEIVVETSIAG